MSEDTKICPFCAEEIKTAAVVCKHCGSRLGSGEPVPMSSTSSLPRKPSDYTPPPKEEKNPAIGFIGMIVLFLVAPAVCLFSSGEMTLAVIIGIVGAGILGYAIVSGNIKTFG